MKKNLLVFVLSFLLATFIFVGLSLAFGTGLLNAFFKITDGWLFGVIFMCAYDVIRKAFNKEKFTRTYICMMGLFAVNVATFFCASITADRNLAIGCIIASGLAGVTAIALPFVVHAIETHGDCAGDCGQSADECMLQNEWAKLKVKIAKLPREKQIEVLKEKLAFRVVGDTIFNAVDLTRGMVSHEGLAMTVKAGKEAGVDPAVIEEAEAYIEALV